VVERALLKASRPGHVLELACGTGLWTRHLAKTYLRVTAVDAAPEVVAINRARVASNRVDYVVADLFSWAPARAMYDLVFFGFWLSHVPAASFEPFWQLVRRALRPGGTAFFVDSLREQTSTAVDQRELDDSGVVGRTLNDGRSFRVVKVFYQPEPLQQRLAHLGWNGAVTTTGKFFLYGVVTPTRSAANGVK
jgi:SAM-dependent methyltransferase